MIRATGKLATLKLKTQGFTKTLDDRMQVVLRQAVRLWIRTIITAGLPPIYTGTTRGSLKPLGQFLRVAIPINPVAFRKDKGPNVGAALGQNFFVGAEPGTFIYVFKFESGVPYYFINEFSTPPRPPFFLRTPTPWFSLQKGRTAFINFIRSEVPRRFPKISEFLEVFTIIIG